MYKKITEKCANAVVASFANKVLKFMKKCANALEASFFRTYGENENVYVADIEWK